MNDYSDDADECECVICMYLPQIMDVSEPLECDAADTMPDARDEWQPESATA